MGIFGKLFERKPKVVEKPQEKAEEKKEFKLFEKGNIPSNKGKFCINNGKVNKYIKWEDPMPEGWVLGGKKVKKD